MDPRAKPLDGRALAKSIERRLAADIAPLVSEGGRAPALAVVLVGDDPASVVYVGRKAKACARAGIHSTEHRLPAAASQQTLLDLVQGLNADPRTDGILVQLPLPGHIDPKAVLTAIDPGKDVDAFHPQSAGHALIGDETLAPCTPQGILLLLDEARIPLRGAEMVIINHSNIVGKPLAAMCINRGATVTVCHKDTRDVARHTRGADIVVTGTGGGRPLRAEDIREGATVVDVSMSRQPDGSLRGDVEPGVWDKAAWVTPVPGGVGPMTIAVLLQNTVRAWQERQASWTTAAGGPRG